MDRSSSTTRSPPTDIPCWRSPRSRGTFCLVGPKKPLIPLHARRTRELEPGVVMQISLRYTLIAVCLLHVGLSPSSSDLAAAYVPRWESTYDPTVVGGSQTAATARLLTDGSTMVVGDDNGSTTAVRFT